MQEAFESVTFGEGLHLSKEPIFSFIHTFIVSKGRFWTNEVHLQLLSMLIFLNDKLNFQVNLNLRKIFEAGIITKLTQNYIKYYFKL